MCISGRKAEGLALSLGWALWLCVAGAAVADDAGSESVAAEAAQAEQAADPAKSAAKSGAAVAETEDEKALLERARAYWDARVAGSNKVYDFYPPDVRERGQLPAEFAGVLYKDHEIERVLAKDGLGVVIVRAQQVLVLGPGVRTQADGFEKQLKAHFGEEWVRVDGTWYKKPIYGGLSRFLRPRPEPGSAAAASEVPKDAGGEAPGSAEP
jgi:hypothetical protein